MRVWKNERGLTLTELMAAVVILGIVAVPLTSLGTTFLHSYQADQQLHEAILLAEQRMVKAKLEIERTGSLAEETAGAETVVVSPYKLDGEEVDGLLEIVVTVTYPDALHPDQTGRYELRAVARQKRVNP